MKVTDIRLTLFALISAIEKDLRTMLKEHILPEVQGLEFLDQETADKARTRFGVEYPGLPAAEFAEDVVDCLDFGDSYTVLQRNSAGLPAPLRDDLRSYIGNLAEVTAIRNRVMHGRPLLAGDFTKVHGFVHDITTIGKYEWGSCVAQIRTLEQDPGCVLGLRIPTSVEEDSHVFHNLPRPDFDDTGFVGRASDVNHMVKLLLGPNSVVSLIGEGGIGKTALMLKAAYDVVDMGEQCPFDLIIWVSSKTTVLTESGISQLQRVTQDYAGVIDEIGGVLDTTNDTLGEKLLEIDEFLQELKVMVVLDNLETIISDQIREFIRTAQEHTKFAITSRVGLGELEIRRPLGGMAKKEAVFLLRSMAQIRNVKILSKCSDENLAKYIDGLYSNPLAIKWFVQAVSAGRTPQDVVAQKADLLDYCMSNVYDSLRQETLLVLDTILSARSKVSEAEILYYSETEPITLRIALNDLLSTSLVVRKFSKAGDAEECLYTVSPMAHDFLIKTHPPGKDFVDSINRKKRELVGTEDSTRVTEQADEFHFRVIGIRNRSEKIGARFLQKALQHSRKRRFQEALKEVEQAKSIVPQYYEVYRIGAFIKAAAGNIMAAEDDYKTALDLEPSNARLLCFYGGFLLRYLDDNQQALDCLALAHKASPESTTVTIEYARCLGYSGNLEGAIELLQPIVDAREARTAKHRRISATLLLDFHKRSAERLLSVEKDVRAALASIQDSIRVFDECVASNDVDPRMAEKLIKVFIVWKNCIAASGDPEERKHFENVYAKYRHYLPSTSEIRSTTIAAQQTDPDQAISDGTERLQGTVLQAYEDRAFAFIQAPGGQRYFFHKKSLRQIEDWERIQNGVQLEFSLGKNNQGECAVDLTFVDVRL